MSAIAVVVLVLLAGATPASAHHNLPLQPFQTVETEAVAGPCPGASITPDRVVMGEFGTEVEGGYVLIPFDVPSGTTAVRVKYCHDQPEAPTNAQIKHVLDLGIYDARGTDGFFDENEFRGWGGSSHPDTTVSPEGFKSEAEYLASPKGHVAGKTTRGFEPGPIPAGEWGVELGVAAVASQSEGDSDGKVAWRVEIELATNPAYADTPYVPAQYDTTPALQQAGWYAGDFHVHAEHSSLGDATMTETFDYAFAPLGTGAGLDFITLSDYVSDSAWGEIGRYQANYPGKQIIRSAEVITYRGHANNHASASYVDYRTGPIYERASNGNLDPVRSAIGATGIFDATHAAGGFTQINHPTIFPSEVPGFDFICRGCPWDYTDAETDYSKVDAVEIATGPAGLKEDPQPGPNPFTPLAIQLWEDGIDSGGINQNKIAAVGSSDSHKAGCQRLACDPVTASPIGVATTVVYAQELSEQGIQDGVEAGHTYVKLFGNDGPDLRLEATVPGSVAPPGIMGDTVYGTSADFTARVIGAGPSAARPGSYTLFVIKDGVPLLSAPVIGDDFVFPFPSVGSGRYRLQLQRGSAIEGVSSPIYLEPLENQHFYQRPDHASAVHASLVPAFRECGTGGNPANRSHQAPYGGSCSPAPNSSIARVGPANTGALELTVAGGDLSITETNSDVQTPTGADYDPKPPGTADLTAIMRIRLTDLRNCNPTPCSSSFQKPATTTDHDFGPIETECAPNGSSTTAPGSSCNLTTTANTFMPGFVVSGNQSVVQLFRFRINDANGVLFQQQGYFAP